jgi:Plasmid maintenance system antidote protein
MGKTNKIRALRYRVLQNGKPITIERLSELTGISVTHLSRIERGERGLSLENAILIAKALGVTVQEVDESFGSVLPTSAEHLAAVEKELFEVLPTLSEESRRSLLDLARRLQKLESGAPSR